MDPNSPPSPPAFGRLALALKLGLAFRASGRTDVDAFLAEHADLRDLLAPIVQPGELGVTEPAPTGRNRPYAPSTFAPGTELDGYVIERELGRGGMGVVFLATQKSLGRRVALKVVSAPAHLLPERARWRFQRESRLLADLDHPGIVRVLEAGTVGDLPFYAMDYVDGVTLHTILDAVRRAGLGSADGQTVRAALMGALEERGQDVPTGAFPPSYADTIVTIVAQVAEALAHAHAAGIVHRDVKPANVLVRRDGRALIADFGIARRDGGAKLTVTGDLAGTPNYMSPEQARGETLDHRTDVFSLGVVLYEGLTLRLPFDGNSQGAILDAVQHARPTEARRLNPAISADLAAVLERALQPQPHLRYQTANDLSADLRAVLERRTVSVRRPSLGLRLVRWARREPWRAAACAALALALTTGAALVASFTLGVLDESQRSAAELAETQRLALGVRLDRAHAEAAAFEPATIEAVPAMKRWIAERGEPLAAELDRLRRTLADLEASALPYSAEDQAADQSRHPEFDKLQRIEEELAHLAVPAPGLDTGNQDSTRTQHLQVTLTQMRARVEQRRTWRFEAEQLEFRHAEVAKLVARLEAFVAADGRLAQVRRLIDRTEEIHRRCQVDAYDAWRATAAAIKGSSQYLGLELQPQRELLPIGRDPQSQLYEFVHIRSGTRGNEVPARGADGRIVPSEDMGIVFVLIPAGRLTMGAQASDSASPNYDPQAGPYEEPVHTVDLAPFFIGKYEITQAQWLRLTGGSTPSHFGSGNVVVKGAPKITPSHPVEAVSWHDATPVLGRHGLGLPTEAQWEYACRAGTVGPWSFADRADAAKYANFADASAKRSGVRWPCEELDDGWVTHAPVGTFLPNPFGLHDMHGNVAEITSDCIGEYSRPVFPGSGRRQTRYENDTIAFRGGNFARSLATMRSTDRTLSETRSFRTNFLGLRAARSLDP